MDWISPTWYSHEWCLIVHFLPNIIPQQNTCCWKVKLRWPSQISGQLGEEWVVESLQKAFPNNTSISRTNTNHTGDIIFRVENTGKMIMFEVKDVKKSSIAGINQGKDMEKFFKDFQSCGADGAILISLNGPVDPNVSPLTPQWCDSKPYFYVDGVKTQYPDPVCLLKVAAKCRVYWMKTSWNIDRKYSGFGSNDDLSDGVRGKQRGKGRQFPYQDSELSFNREAAIRPLSEALQGQWEWEETAGAVERTFGHSPSEDAQRSRSFTSSQNFDWVWRCWWVSVERGEKSKTRKESFLTNLCDWGDWVWRLVPTTAQCVFQFSRETLRLSTQTRLLSENQGCCLQYMHTETSN